MMAAISQMAKAANHSSVTGKAISSPSGRATMAAAMKAGKVQGSGITERTAA